MKAKSDKKVVKNTSAKSKQKSQKMTMQEMIEKVDASKKVNPLDLSSDQDLSIALMNLISLEEHFFFSGAKTQKTGFYDLINVVRDMRKELMARIVKKSTAENGEVWCISKHLLAASMRLFEVGTKALAAGDKDGAYDLFDRSYGLYCIFWGLNMGMINGGVDVKWVKTKKSSETDRSAQAVVAMDDMADGGKMSRLKKWVKNAVNCCIE